MQNGAAAEQQAQATGKKVKISFDEFKKLAFMIISIMKEQEHKGEENVRQGDIVDLMVQKIELDSSDRQTSIERTVETSKKVQNVIHYLITNENILMISQDARAKADRFLTLNMNVDLNNANTFLSGGNASQV